MNMLHGRVAILIEWESGRLFCSGKCSATTLFRVEHSFFFLSILLNSHHGQNVLTANGRMQYVRFLITKKFILKISKCLLPILFNFVF